MGMHEHMKASREYEPDWQELEEAARQRRRRRTAGRCRCGHPDWPGQCPGWENCPVWGDEEND